METNFTSLSELKKKPRNLSLPFVQRRPQFYLPGLISRSTNWYGLLIIHKFYINDKEEKFFTFHNLDIKIVLHSLFTAVSYLI